MSDDVAPARQVLLIAAHGSSTDQRARDQVLAQAARIAQLVPHEQTLTGFARGIPSVADAVAQCLADGAGATVALTVLPFMTSAGHYAGTVLPRLLADAAATTGAAALTYQVLRPIGASRRIASLLHRRALRLAARQGWTPDSVAVVLVGHGTPRTAASRDTATAHARALAARGWGGVHAAFIDDEPRVGAVMQAVAQRRIVVLPFLIGGGAHHLVDVPMALGFAPSDDGADAPGSALRDAARRTVVLDAPIGSDDTLAQIAADLAARAWQRAVAAPDAAARVRRGTVHLVGAGPGAADLITLRGRRAVQQADVVLYDRLVAPTLLALARPDARLIDVGKEADTPQASQQAINARLVAEAHAGNHVVRLKGGDPFVFGRGSEEAEACRAAGIAVRVTPGITSALAAPAAAGIPVTTRHVSRGFAVVTASTDSDDAQTLAHLAAYAHADTLVVLMGRARLRALATLLVSAGRDADTPVACVERATLPGQRVVRGTLATIAGRADRAALMAPMVIVIGATAARRTLHADVAKALIGATSA